MNPWRVFAVLAGLTVTFALLVPGASTATSESVAKWDGHLDLEWTLVRDHKLTTGPLATGPEGSVLVTVPRNDSKGFALQRLGGDPGDQWSTKWIVRDGPVRRLVPQALAVSRASQVVVVAGRGTCRSDVDALRDRGPVFIRAYSLSGQVRWTRWIGGCPRPSADRRARILSVSGADMWRGAMAISFTQGNSGSSGVHRREGHVVSLNSAGRVRWRSTLPFPSSVKEVVTHDVTISRHVVAVVGEVVRSDSRGSFTVGLSRRTGAVRWRDVRGGRIVDDAQCLESIDSSGRALYLAGIGPAGRGVLERRTSSGDVRWRSRVPRCVTVSALNQGGALWTGIAWQRAGSPIIFGQQRASGEAAWRQEVSLPTGKWPAEPVFAADDRIAVGTADLISRKTGNSSVYLWYWRWR